MTKALLDRPSTPTQAWASSVLDDASACCKLGTLDLIPLTLCRRCVNVPAFDRSSHNRRTKSAAQGHFAQFEAFQAKRLAKT